MTIFFTINLSISVFSASYLGPSSALLPFWVPAIHHQPLEALSIARGNDRARHNSSGHTVADPRDSNPYCLQRAECFG
jgi:hypothetical protein